MGLAEIGAPRTCAGSEGWGEMCLPGAGIPDKDHTDLEAGPDVVGQGRHVSERIMGPETPDGVNDQAFHRRPDIVPRRPALAIYLVLEAGDGL
jgi:hypothetical protein